jgi:hypothetical protein
VGFLIHINTSTGVYAFLDDMLGLMKIPGRAGNRSIIIYP